MSNEEINQAIAQALGAKWYASGKFVVLDFKVPANPLFREVAGPDGFEDRRVMTPNYAGDLNAMHEAEKMLDQHQAGLYDDHLANSEQDGTWSGCHIWHQSAAQRTEAFLRVFGKWKEGA